MVSEAINIALKALDALASDRRIALIARALGDSAELHVVGGTVRDILLGIAQTDIDLATKLSPDEVAARCQKAGIHLVPTGLQHQTVTAIPIQEMEAVEITTFRGAGMSPEGGVVSGESIEEDLQYRDFTVNALAYSLTDKKLLDLSTGAADLKAKVIRAVGEPGGRFSEDPLRVLRMIRFACQLGFSIDPQTEQASKRFGPELKNISPERIRDELSKILVSDRVEVGFQQLHELGFLKIILPEIELFVNYEQNDYHRSDLFVHTMEVVKNVPTDLALRLAALLHDVGKPATLSVDQNGERHFYRHEVVGADMAKLILRRLRFSNRIIQEVCTLVRTHMRPLDVGAGGMRRLIRDTDVLFNQWRTIKIADINATGDIAKTLPTQLEAFDKVLAYVLSGPEVSPLKNLAVNGADIMALGVPEGPRVGEILRALHEMVLDKPELNEKQKLLSLARSGFV